jgi:hypothetical protein
MCPFSPDLNSLNMTLTEHKVDFVLVEHYQCVGVFVVFTLYVCVCVCVCVCVRERERER